MLNGLDLFSGYGGLTLALQEWVKPILYCEIERYAQGILLSRMLSRELPEAPIWEDITTLEGKDFKGRVDIIYGGFPCQDISIAGAGKGLEGERSGLFFEIVRLISEIRPSFIFLENVAAILSRGHERVCGEMVKLGYDCRWKILSAKEVGAPHNRKRWWLLGYSKHNGPLAIKEQGIFRQTVCNDKEGENEAGKSEGAGASRVLAHSDSMRKLQQEGCEQDKWGWISDSGRYVPNSMCKGLERQRQKPVGVSQRIPFCSYSGWWEVEPSVGRVVDGCPFRAHRIKALGNGVVPLQAKEAFKNLMGIATKR